MSVETSAVNLSTPGSEESRLSNSLLKYSFSVERFWAMLSCSSQEIIFRSDSWAWINLSQRLIQAQESERKMISCELHDSIAQNLSTLKLYFSRLFESRLSSEPGVERLTADVSTLIDQTITIVRNLAYSLRPAGLDHLGLLHVLETY